MSATDETPAAAIVKRQPRWSDLVVTAVHPGEIDVTRVQMLFFTLISAGFVALKLFNSYVIPDIPEGFMLLMGISNGVYIWPGIREAIQGMDPSRRVVNLKLGRLRLRSRHPRTPQRKTTEG